MKYEKVEVNSDRWFDLTPLLNEKFRDIKGYENKYQVSNYGRVKSLERIVLRKDGTKLTVKTKITGVKNNNIGYYQCVLHNKKPKFIFIHTLVSQTFLNKENFKYMPHEDKKMINLDKLEINHKDENKQNNCVDNLEWCTHSYNINYGNRNKMMIEKNINNPKLSKKVNQYDLEGNLIKTWISMSEAQRQLRIFKQAIYQCCVKKKKTAGGYKWRYADEL